VCVCVCVMCVCVCVCYRKCVRVCESDTAGVCAHAVARTRAINLSMVEFACMCVCRANSSSGKHAASDQVPELRTN